MRRIPDLWCCIILMTILLAACSGPGAATPTVPPTAPLRAIDNTATPLPATTRVAPTLAPTPPTIQPSVPGPAAGNIAACGIRPIPPSTVTSTPRMGPAQMVTATIGWATAVGRLNDFSIVRTTDGGGHWQSVTPPGIWDHLAGEAAFLGESNAWVILLLDDAPTPPTSARIVILATHDGGRSWQCGEPFVPGGIPKQLMFADSRHGSLVVEGVATFVTDDGGLHWARAAVR